MCLEQKKLVKVFISLNLMTNHWSKGAIDEPTHILELGSYKDANRYFIYKTDHIISVRISKPIKSNYLH